MNCSRTRDTSHESGSDVILNLPSDVIEYILSCLSIRDAVRTSILSRNWRYQWVTLSHLVFKDKGIDGTFFKHQSQDELVKVINGVLMQHNGPILEFTLSIKNMRSRSHIDQWIRILSKNGIEKFFLEFSCKEHYRLPSYFFSCQQLRCIVLKYCLIQPPLTFTGFRKLTSLNLFSVTIMASVFESLISNCPLLEQLFVASLTGSDCLNIHAPNLKILWFLGRLKSMCIKYAPCLTSMVVVLFPNFSITEPTEHTKAFDLSGLSRINSLDLSGGFLEFPFFLCLIRNSPNLQRLQLGPLFAKGDMKPIVEFIEAAQKSSNCCLKQLLVVEMSGIAGIMKPIVEFIEAAQKSSNCCLKQLLVVEMSGIASIMPEMELIKFLLAKSPAMKIMRIECDKENPFFQESRMSDELMHFTRASPKVQILLI